MSWHLNLHYLDLFRHDLAFTWAWTNWIGNIAAGIVVFFVMSLLWPRMRRKYEAWFKCHMKEIHDHLDKQHKERMAQMAKNHKEAITLAKTHHAERLAAIAPKVVKAPAKPGVKK